MKTVLIPKENEKDLVEIKPEVTDGMKIIPVSTIKQAFPYVFGKVSPVVKIVKK
jgi:ATP-dependent Lon protease